MARATARRIGLPDGTQRGLYEVAEFWSGGAAPQALSGDRIAVAARVARVASDAVFFDDVGGVERAVAAVTKRAGGVLDPHIVDAFVADASDLLAEVGPEAGDPRDRILEVEPDPFLECGRDDIAGVAAAFGDLSDLKSPYFHGHAAEVARLAVEAARRVRARSEGRSADRDRRPAPRRRASGDLQLDLGKAGSLTRAEWEQVRMHAYHSERVLATSASLEPMAVLAGMHHERLDGSGYHRGSKSKDIGAEPRLLAAADAFAAMVQPRPHRAALTPDEAATRLTDEARAGRLDRDAVTGCSVPPVRSPAAVAAPLRDMRPASLTEREVGGSRPRRGGLLQRRHRRTALHLPSHGGAPRPARLLQDRRLDPRRAALFAVEHDLLPYR